MPNTINIPIAQRAVSSQYGVLVIQFKGLDDYNKVIQ